MSCIMLVGKSCAKCNFAKKLVKDENLEHLVVMVDVTVGEGKEITDNFGIKTIPAFIFRKGAVEIVETSTMKAIKRLKEM